MSRLTTELIFCDEAEAEEEEEWALSDLVVFEDSPVVLFLAVVPFLPLPEVEVVDLFVADVALERERETVAGLAFLAEVEPRWGAFVAFSSFSTCRCVLCVVAGLLVA